MSHLVVLPLNIQTWTRTKVPSGFCLSGTGIQVRASERRRLDLEAVVDSQEPTETPADPGDVRAQQDRIWQHGLHADTMLFQRGNLFLVAESFLAVAYATSLSGSAAHDEAALTARALAVFGLFLSAIWMYVGHRHLSYFNLIRERQTELLPDYRETRERWARAAPMASRISSLPLVTYALPALAGVMWLFFLVTAG